MTASPLVTRTGLAQLLALAGLGGAFALGGVEPPAALAAPACAAEDQCTFKRPVLMFILDYSTSMNAPLGEGLSRWEAAVASVQSLVAADNSFVASNMLVGLLRFGHDPDPEAPGTAIPGDASGLVDGQAVDVVWFDEQHAYKPCDGAALIDALAAAPAPLDGASEGIGTWTDGALQRSRALLVESLASHPEDAPSQDDRRYLQLVLTDGEWTDPDGVGQSPAHDPAATAAALWDDGVGDPDDPTHVLTYVVYFGELQGAGEAAAGQLAAAGGSGEALLAADPQALTVAIHDVIAEIQDSVSTPDCTAGLPRIMVLVDASSSMLNDGESGVALPGLSGWDQARFAIAGDPSGQNLSLFERELEPGVTVADYVHVGLAVFGTDEPAEERILFQYGPCRQDNAYWAMAPEVSHGDCPKIDYTPLLYAPATPIRSLIDACDLPWKGPPILWSSPSVVAGAPGPEDDPPGPGFDDETHAHMPRCDLTADFELPICVGSGTFTHRGLELIRANQEAYHLDAVGKGEANDDTQYVNILITDGQYAGFSTDYQVSSQLKAMAEDGIRTFVVAFGSGLQSSEAQLQLLQMAQWGDTEKPYYADSQVQLETVLADIVLALDFDPCCQFNDCSENPEPTGGDPDPAGECQGDADCPP
ncbi:MAG: hypothetical protein KC636_17500, partial [Myxococcales bacterium]|nr:hypothetical protein [Myxococcales bacterium]